MPNKLKEFPPHIKLQKHIAAYWTFRNTTEKKIYFPVVPDGCSDIVFYLNNSSKLGNIESTFVTGIMEKAQIIPIPDKMELFGIRFKPSILHYVLQTDMKKLKNNMLELSQVNKSISRILKINSYATDEEIVLEINSILIEIFENIRFNNNFFLVLDEIIKNPDFLISDLCLKYGFSTRNLQRLFLRRIGLSPKKFARIMKFQKAHRKISKKGLEKLVFIALSSGYFDQAHFNHEYKKLVGFNPSHETMSILYNKNEK